MGILDTLKKLLNPGAVSQPPPPSPAPQAPVSDPSQGVPETPGVSSAPSEAPVAEPTTMPVPAQAAPETKMPSTTSVEPEAPISPAPESTVSTPEPDIKG